MSKVLLVLSALLGIGAAGIGYLNKQRADQLAIDLSSSKESEAKLKGELASKEKLLTETEDKLKVTEQEKEEVSRNLQAAKNEVKSLSDQIASVKNQIAEKDQKINDLTSTIEKMKEAQTADAEAEKSEDNVAAEIETLKTEKAELQQLNQSLTAKLEQAEAQIKSLAEAERARQEGIMRKSLEGRVLAVNSAWGFVVISIGDRQRVVQGTELLVRRGSTMIGKVRVTSVEPSQSIADILQDSMMPGLQVQPGDLVIFPGS